MVDIRVEVRPNATAGDLSRRAAKPEELLARLNDLADSLQCIAAKMSARFSEFEGPPQRDWHLDEIELKFSIDLEAEAGVIIARASTTAGFEAKLAWKKCDSR